MANIIDKINRRLFQIAEDISDTSWKDPNDANYDRQVAEDALYHTIGPLTDNPKWVDSWTSPSQPVPGFNPGGIAPRWSPEEVVFAYAGDPGLLFEPRVSARSPSYGRGGGAPLYRLARKISRQYRKDRDPQFVMDMYQNGMIPLVRMMQPGFDEGRSSFIPFVAANIKGAMQHGTGGSREAGLVAGGTSKGYGSEGSSTKSITTGLRGLQAVLDSDSPEKVREMANQVKGKYQSTKSHDKNPDNPFGPYSSRFYQAAMLYADALESGNPDRIEAAQSQIMQLKSSIEDEEVSIRGASTGLGQAVSSLSRTDKVGVQSIDQPLPGSDDGSTMAGNIEGDSGDDSWINPESVQFVLKIALEHDIGSVISKMPKYRKLAAELAGEAEEAGVKVGGKLTANELRYVIRGMGPLGSNYPGAGNMRSAVNVPRDAKGWWKPGEDPEIEPIPGGSAIWNSIWKRNNYQHMGSTAIAIEMTEEVREFEKLGIATARKVTEKKKTSEAVSKVAVNSALQAALLKLKLIATIHREQLGLSESVTNGVIPILEGIDPVDRMIIQEAADFIVRRVGRMIVFDDAPRKVRVVKGPVNYATYADFNRPLSLNELRRAGERVGKRSSK
jgi:hypothetical protein